MKREHPSSKLSVVRDAVDVVVRRLSALPPSPEIDELRKKAEGFRREAEGWSSAPPTAEDRERLMKLVLKIHVEVTKAEREVAEPK
jgi:hypothetical protein